MPSPVSEEVTAAMPSVLVLTVPTDTIGEGPVLPAGPAIPVGPVLPVGPVIPAGPVTPVSPVLPVGPISPLGPCGIEKCNSTPVSVLEVMTSADPSAFVCTLPTVIVGIGPVGPAGPVSPRFPRMQFELESRQLRTEANSWVVKFFSLKT